MDNFTQTDKLDQILVQLQAQAAEISALKQLTAEISALKQLTVEQQEKITSLETGQKPDSPAFKGAGPTSRRRMLKKLAGAAALAAAASITTTALQTPETAQAAFTLQGDFKNISTTNTTIQGPGGAPPFAIILSTTPVLSILNSNTSSAIVGKAGTFGFGGVIGESPAAGSIRAGIIGINSSSGSGVRAMNTSTGYGLRVESSSNGTGAGAAIYIVPGSGGAPGAAAAGTDGAASPGQTQAVASARPSPSSAPTGGGHSTGEIVSDPNGKLFYCAADGTPGTWGQIAPLVFLPSPLRVVGAPNTNYAPGTFASLADGSINYFKMEGSWTDNNPSGPYTAVIPPQATALLATISTINTTTSGYLTVYPADQPQPVVAIMGFGPGFVTSNSITVKLGPIPSGPDAGTQGVAVFTYSNGANVNLAFDVVGYFL